MTTKKGGLVKSNSRTPLAQQKSNRGRKKRIILGLFAAFFVFMVGVQVGNGTISTDSVFKKSANTQLPSDLDYSSVERVYDTLRKSYDGKLSVEELLDGLKAGLASASGDPYTEFLSTKDAEEFNEGLTGSFTGIGAELGKDENAIIIVSPISGFPAEKAGLKPKDIILEIDGKSAYNLNITEAVKKIRGEEGTKVTLKILRGKSEQKEFTITREVITIPSVESKILDGNIGYIKLSRFSEDTVGLTKKAAEEFKSKNVKGVVLDMRGNPGGLLDAAVGVSSVWVPRGKNILSERRGGLEVKTFEATGGSILYGVKTVVLIDEGSASASEITAGALKDNGVATIFGVKSFGKGSVQSLEEFTDGSVLKVTIARWYTPAGKNIDKEGISPDKEVKITEKDIKAGKDPQLEAAKLAL
jgi:carboxyl-terminal processing protease